MDNRTDEEFAKDIKSCTSIEQKLIQIYVKYLNDTSDTKTYEYINNGVDNTGKFIQDDKKIVADADFIIKHPDFEDKPVEIKFSRKLCSDFHLKLGQVNKYIETNTTVVMFMGIDKKNTKFCILAPSDLQHAIKHNKHIHFKAWGGKLCIKFNTSECEWIYV